MAYDKNHSSSGITTDEIIMMVYLKMFMIEHQTNLGSRLFDKT